MSDSPDTELTLSTGKLLALFFGLVAVCAIFFSLGYAVGKNSAPAAPTSVVDSASLSNVQPSGGAKPPAGSSPPAPAPATEAKPCVAGEPNCPAPASNAASNTPAQPESVQKALQQGYPNAQLTPAEPPKSAPAPDASKPSTGGIMVQVAAVSKQEDAEALVNALRKKQYPVFMVSGANDSLYRVQVGPFTDAKEAEAMKAKLVQDGYNAIVKK